jgi:hypothetical protein
MTAEERIAALDERFVQTYEATRGRLLDAQKQRALILVTEDYMLFYHRGREPQVIGGLRPPPYDKMKTLGHVPLAIYCLLIEAADDGGTIPPPVMNELKDYRAQLADAAEDFDTTAERASGLLPQSVDIHTRALAFLDRVIEDERIGKEDLTAFGRGNVADLNAIFFAATKAQLDACHALMMDLKQNVLSDDDWNSLRVVVMGPHMAHKDHNFLQYFAKLLHTLKYTDKRLVYFEGEDAEAALDLMATAILDLRASHAIFGGEGRLHRDVLADATKRYLDDLFPG